MASAMPPIATPDVVFVTTSGQGSMDGYSQQLVEHLRVRTLETDVYQRTAELFKVPLLSATSLWGFAQDLAFVRLLRQQEGLLHLPNHHLGRYGCFLTGPYLITVHDLIRYFDLIGMGPFIHRPNLRDRVCLRLDYRGIRRATAIIAVSRTTKRDLVTHLRVPEERIFVVYEGVDPRRFHPVERRVVEDRYILYVGSEHPRKNLETLLRALARLRREREFQDLKLVKVGAAGGREADFRARTLAFVRELGLEDRVIFTERVPADDLPAYYSGAACLVLPSRYEGFGFPPLEAMACGCPVVVAEAGSLPEITGGAALRVPTEDDAGFAEAIRTLLVDRDLRARMRERGFARAREFSWRRAAEETVRVYEMVRRQLARGRFSPAPAG
ncbi:MAG TPA: glycosyltransferase family 1 protein [Candidatus Dormibacteraeota bacterium]|jgi:glycosyltransferase involved in cell wall biosynthesis|nr:glycosyltransferase family 1 protein [Candidatus Dormibacteraeota bacterium]